MNKLPSIGPRKFNSSFPGKSLQIIDSIVPFRQSSISNILDNFHALPEYGDIIKVHNNRIIPGDFYTEQLLPGEKSATHFQGILRIPGTNYLILSGADVRNQYAQIFLAELGAYLEGIKADNKTKIKATPFGSNCVIDKYPPVSDFLQEVYKFDDKGYYHAGGMDIDGQIVAVPIENRKGESKVKFIDVSHPEELKVIANTADILRSKAIGKGGASCLVRLASQKYLCGVWTDSDQHPARLDLYLSQNESIENGFEQARKPVSIHWNKIVNHPKKRINYQNLQMFENSDGNIYLLGTDNPKDTTPVLSGGVNRAHIMKVTMDYSKDGYDLLDSITTEYIGHKTFSKSQYPFNFRAGAGFSKNHLGELSLYGVAHWRTEETATVSIGEFIPFIKNNHNPINHIDGAIIELYEESDFGFIKQKDGSIAQKKRCLKLYGKRYERIEEFKKINVQGIRNFKDRVSSVRYIIPKGWKCTLYVDKEYQGDSIELIGTGHYKEIQNLEDKNFGDCLSSVKFSRC